MLRPFCRIYLEPVPDDTTLLRWAHLIGPATLTALNARVVELARQRKVTRGRKLRVDSTVVETTIHHPTDSRLLGDGVRVLSRLLRRAQAVVGPAAELGRDAFRRRTRSVRRAAQTIHRVARRKGAHAAEELQQVYRKLIRVAAQTRRQAVRVCAVFRRQTDVQAQRLVQQFDHYLPLVAQTITQATRRLLQGETVPAPEKLLRLFEPHTQVIVRHKPGTTVEFGRKLWLEEVEGGIISGYRVLDAPGQDAPELVTCLAAHQQRFGYPPWLLTGDRGVASRTNEQHARPAGVRRVVLPATGRVTTARVQQERARWFRRGYRFRAGIEGRISVLRRSYGLARCRDHGEQGMGRWVGWGIMAHNLAKIARTVARRTPRPPARAA